MIIDTHIWACRTVYTLSDIIHIWFTTITHRSSFHIKREYSNTWWYTDMCVCMCVTYHRGNQNQASAEWGAACNCRITPVFSAKTIVQTPLCIYSQLTTKNKDKLWDLSVSEDPSPTHQTEKENKHLSVRAPTLNSILILKSL